MQRTLLSSRQCLGRCAPLPARPLPTRSRASFKATATNNHDEAFSMPDSLVGVMGALALFITAGPAYAETDLSALLEKRYADVQGKPVETSAPKRLRTVTAPAAPAPPPAAAAPKPTAVASTPAPTPAPKPAPAVSVPTPAPAAPVAKKATSAPAAAAPAAAAGAAAGSASSTPLLAGAGAVVVAALGALGLSGNKKEKEADPAPVGKKITKAVPAKAAAVTKIAAKAIPRQATKVITKGPAGTKITGKTAPVIKAVPTKAPLTPATAKVVKAPAPPPKKAPVGTKVVGTKITGRPQPVGTKVVGTKAVGTKAVGTKAVGGTKITRAAPTPKPSYEEDDSAKNTLLGGLLAVALFLAAGITLNTKPTPSKAPEPKLSDTEKELVTLLAEPKKAVASSTPAPPVAATPTPAPAPKVIDTPAPQPTPAPAPIVTPPPPPPAPIAKVAETPATPPPAPAPKAETPAPTPPPAEPSLSDLLKSAAATPPPAPKPAAAPATPARATPAPTPAPVAVTATATEAAPAAPAKVQPSVLIGASVAVLAAGAIYASSQSSVPEAAAPAAAPSSPLPASSLVLSEEDKNKLREVYRRLFKNENFKKLWTAILTSSGLTIKEEEFEKQLLEGPLFDQLLPAILKELPAEKVSALLALKDDASITSLETALSEVKVDEAAVAQAAKEVTQEVKQSLGSA